MMAFSQLACSLERVGRRSPLLQNYTERPWKMKNRDERLESHIRELENFYHSPPETKSKPDIGAHDRRKLESAFEKAHARRTPRGRPPAWQSRNECTYQSFEVFVFVVGEMRTFKKRHGTKRVSAK